VMGQSVMNSTSWEIAKLIAELLGTTGVFASLFYLARQMRLSAAETRDASIHSIMQLAIQFRAESYRGELAEIRMKAAVEEPLTPLELLKFEGYLSALFELTELVYVQYQKGKLDPEYFAAWELRTRAAFAISHVERFWAKSSSGYRQSFIQHINQLIES
jgi:hypothetical protein